MAHTAKVVTSSDDVASSASAVLTARAVSLATGPAHQLPTSNPSFSVAARALWRLTKPNLSLFVMITTTLGLFLASDGALTLSTVLFTLLGTVLTAGGACGVNMVWERDYDAMMPRTAARPIPSGELPVRTALIFSLALIGLGASLLDNQVNRLTALISLFTAAVYIFVYTPLKRVGPIAVWVGAIPGALPPVMGFTAVRGHLDVEALLVFSILFFWQLPHFWSLGMMYQEDYKLGGFKLVSASSSRLVSQQILAWTMALVVVGLQPAVFGFAGITYIIGTTAVGLWLLARAIRLTLNPADKKQARTMFLGTLVYLPVVILSLLADRPMALLRLFGWP